ncbi:MAG: hemerythrin domain-containing protein [Candidatus Saliniplasma sp.]
MNTKYVTEILKDYHDEKISSKETVDKLKEATPLDLYMAEVELIEEGFSGKELAGISQIFLQLVGGFSKNILKDIDSDHPIRKLVGEHERVKSLLLTIETHMKHEDIETDMKNTVKYFIETITELQKHFDREEEVIFPRLNNLKKVGRTILLEEEHGEILEMRDELQEALSEGTVDTEDVKEILYDIITDLRMHTFFESDMLYPTALEILDDWDEIKKESDHIGYCKFQPM